MKKTSNIIIRVDDEVKNRFQELVDRNDVTMSSVLNECMIEMINKDNIPIRIKCRLNAKKPKQESLDIAKIKKALEETIQEAQLKDKITKAYLFGSYSRGEQNADSDVDLLIVPDNMVGLFKLSGMMLDLQDLLQKRVDLVTEKGLLPFARERVDRDKILIYERAA